MLFGYPKFWSEETFHEEGLESCSRKKSIREILAAFKGKLGF